MLEGAVNVDAPSTQASVYPYVQEQSRSKTAVPARWISPAPPDPRGSYAVEHLYTANVADLISDIRYSNKVGGQNTIVLQATKGVAEFDVTSPIAPAPAEGPTGLPEIAAGNQLTIVGGGTIARSTQSGTPTFRLFDVAVGASLKLENLTVTNGEAYGSGAAAEGGAVYCQGTLVLKNVILFGNNAVGSRRRLARERQGKARPAAPSMPRVGR